MSPLNSITCTKHSVKSCSICVEVTTPATGGGSSCDSSPSFLSVFSKKRKMDFPEGSGGGAGMRNSRKGKEKVTEEREGNQHWAPQNVIFFIDLMYRLFQDGKILNSNFRNDQYQVMALQMQMCCPIKPLVTWTAKQLMTKARALCTHWNNYHNLLTRQTGWGMDNELGRIVAPEGAWDDYILAHPAAKEWGNKPLWCYDELTDMWKEKTASGRYALGSTHQNPINFDADSPEHDLGQHSGSKSSGKRSSHDWREDDPIGVVRQKTSVNQRIERSLSSWERYNEKRLAALEAENFPVDVGQITDEIMIFCEEVEIDALLRGIDILCERHRLAFLFLRWNREMKLRWLITLLR